MTLQNVNEVSEIFANHGYNEVRFSTCQKVGDLLVSLGDMLTAQTLAAVAHDILEAEGVLSEETEINDLEDLAVDLLEMEIF